MAKIALLLSGFVRRHQLRDIHEHIIRPNVDAGHDVRIFASTWDTFGTVSSQPNADKVFSGTEYWTGLTRTYDNDLIDKAALEFDLESIAPGRFCVRYNRYEDLARKWLKEPFDIADARGWDEHTLLRARGMWFGMMDAFSMIPRPSRYDFIIRCRFDIRFREPIVVSSRRRLFETDRSVHVGNAEYPLSLETCLRNPHIDRVKSYMGPLPLPRSAMLIPVRENGYCDDWFAIGTARSMASHMSIFSRLRDYLVEMYKWPDQPAENETLTVFNAMCSGIALHLFPKSIYL